MIIKAFPLTERPPCASGAGEPLLHRAWAEKAQNLCPPGRSAAPAIFLTRCKGFALSLRLNEDAVVISCGRGGKTMQESGITAPWLRSAPAVRRVRLILAGCGLGGRPRYPTSRQPGQGSRSMTSSSRSSGPGGLSRRRHREAGRVADSGGGGAGVGRQQLPVAGVARHRVVHAAGLGRSVRRRHHHRLVLAAAVARRALQGQRLYSRPRAQGRWHSGLGIPPADRTGPPAGSTPRSRRTRRRTLRTRS